MAANAEHFSDSVIQEIIATLRDRLTSPTISSLVIAWCISNYRFFVILFADIPIESTFRHIDGYFVENWLVHSLLIPLAVTGIYLFAYPFWDEFVSNFRLKRQIRANEKQQELASIKLLTEEQSKSIYRQMTELQMSHANERAMLDRELAALRPIVQEKEQLVTELAAANASIAHKTARIEALENSQLNNLLKPVEFENKNIEPSAEMPLLDRVIKAGVKLSTEELALLAIEEVDRQESKEEIVSTIGKRLKLMPAKARHTVGELDHTSLIESITASGGTRVVALTHLGLTELLKLRSRLEAYFKRAST